MLGGERRLVPAAIAQQVQKITPKPVGKTYIAIGVWDWLGGVAVRMLPGGRIVPDGLCSDFRLDVAAFAIIFFVYLERKEPGCPIPSFGRWFYFHRPLPNSR